MKTVNAKQIKDFVKKYAIIGVLLLLIVLATIIQPVFLSPRNITNVLRQVAVNGILAIGMTFVIISGCVDLSVGGIWCMTGITVLTIMPKVGWFAAILIGLLLGAVLGAFNGYMVYRGMPAFIMTFSMQIILQGLAYIVCGGVPVHSRSEIYNAIGQSYWFGIPSQVYFYLILVLVASFVMKRTRFGRNVYAIGGNAEVARLSGIDLKKMRIAIYVVSGVLASLAAVIGTSRLGSCEPTLGLNYHSNAIAATVIGGTLMSGGEGAQWRTLIGVLILGVMSNVLNLMGITSYIQYVFQGAIIIIAVALDMFRRTQKK